MQENVISESSAQLTSEAFCQVIRKVPRLQQSKSHSSKLGKHAMLLTKDRNQMFQPIFARYPWPETFKTSFSRTNQMVNMRGRQKKCEKIFLNFTNLHKTQPGQKTAGTFPIFFEDIYAPYVLESRFGCRFKDPLPTMILCAPIEKQDKGDLGQKGLSDNTKVAFGVTKDHG